MTRLLLTLLAAICAAPFALAAQPTAVANADVPPLPIDTPADKLRHAAADAAIRYVVPKPLVESNIEVSERVRRIVINDRGNLCVVEVTFIGAKDLDKVEEMRAPTGWLVSKSHCASSKTTDEN